MGSWWDNFVRIFKGKNIAILGERESGKTVLTNFLRNGYFSTDYQQTLTYDAVPAGSLKLGDLKLHIKKGADVGGAEDNYKLFEQVYLNSHFCFYLLRGDKALNGNVTTEKRIRQDADNFAVWRKNLSSPPPIYFIITHVDHDPAFLKVNSQTRGTYEDNIRNLPVIKQAMQVAKVPAANVIVGNLGTESEMISSVYRLMKAVQG